MKRIFSTRICIKKTIERLEEKINENFIQSNLFTVALLYFQVYDSPFFNVKDHHKFRSKIGCAN